MSSAYFFVCLKKIYIFIREKFIGIFGLNIILKLLICSLIVKIGIQWNLSKADSIKPTADTNS